MPDQGTFETLPNGDVSETGVMYNPKTQRYQKYVEVWRRYATQPGTLYWILERIEPDGSTDRHFAGRVGSHALRLSQEVGGDYNACRTSDVEGETETIFQTSKGSAAPGIAECGALSTGQTVTIGGEQWLVRTAGRL